MEKRRRSILMLSRVCGGMIQQRKSEWDHKEILELWVMGYGYAHRDDKVCCKRAFMFITPLLCEWHWLQ
jgi:hypothetical protein